MCVSDGDLATIPIVHSSWIPFIMAQCPFLVLSFRKPHQSCLKLNILCRTLETEWIAFMFLNEAILLLTLEFQSIYSVTEPGLGFTVTRVTFCHMVQILLVLSYLNTVTFYFPWTSAALSTWTIPCLLCLRGVSACSITFLIAFHCNLFHQVCESVSWRILFRCYLCTN